MILPIRVVQGDYGYSQPFAIQNLDGTVFDLTNCTAVINIQFAQASGIKTSGGTIVIDTASSGLCHYVVQNGDFNESGTYTAQIVISPSGGGQITVPDIVFVATKALPTF